MKAQMQNETATRYPLPFPSIVREDDSPPLKWWQRLGLRIGTHEAMTAANQPPRLNAAVLALLTLVILAGGIIAGLAYMIGDMNRQVLNLNEKVGKLEEARKTDQADNAKYLEGRLSQFKEELEQPSPKGKK